MTEKSEKTKKELMAFAHMLFMEKGYEKVSVESICEAAKKAKGLFFYHFIKKENIVKLLLEEQIRDLSSALSVMLEGMEIDSTDKMNYLMNQLVSKHSRGPSALYYFEEIPEWIDLYANSLRDKYVFPIILSICEEGIASGTFRKCSKEEIEIIYLGISGFVHKNQLCLKNQEYYRVTVDAISRTLESALGIKKASIYIE